MAEKASMSRIATTIPRNGSRTLARKVERMKKEGKEVLHLTTAPVEPPGANVLEAAVRAVQSNRRASSRGFAEFREAAARKLLDENGIRCDPETDILPTNGSMHAIMTSLAGSIDPGDEVLLLSPCFYYSGAVSLVGGVPRYVRFEAENRFCIDLDRIERAVSPKTRAVIWNTPINPTGYVASESDTRGMADLALKHNLTVIADEAFEKWTFDGRRHLSIGSIPEVRERVITVHSFSKSYSMARWRIGYLAAPGNKVDHFQKILEHSLLECNSIAQAAAAEALAGPQEWVENLAVKIRRQRDIVIDGLGSIDRIGYPVPQGGPSVYVDVSGIADSSEAFSDYILYNYGIPAVPGEAFNHPGSIRFCFAGDEAPLRKALDRLKAAVERFPNR